MLAHRLMATSQSRKIATLISDAAIVRMTSNCSNSGCRHGRERPAACAEHVRLAAVRLR